MFKKQKRTDNNIKWRQKLVHRNHEQGSLNLNFYLLDSNIPFNHVPLFST